MAAGDSPVPESKRRLEADRARALADEHARRAGIATQMARNFEGAARSTTRLAQTLIELESLGYTLLTHRRWPGSHRAVLDLVLVGPGGVIIVDAKTWSDVQVADQQVFRGHEDVTDEIARLADLVYITQRSLADLGLAAGEVRAIAAFATPFVPRVTVFGVTLRSEAATVTDIAKLGIRLTQQQVTRVRNALELLFPPTIASEGTPSDDTDAITIDIDTRTRPAVDAWQQTTEITIPGAPEPEHLSAEQIRSALIEGLRRTPIEPWMAFLTPEQAHAVRKSFAGPARIRGAAGTGKTVVALHRAAYLARSTGGRVLVISQVRTLPKVLATLAERLAPDVADRIDFRGVHAFARDLLVERRGELDIDASAADRVFKDLWNRLGTTSELGRIDPAPGYWYDEIRYLLKGRGLQDFADYASLARVGRLRSLSTAQRALVWNLYHAYETALRDREIFDWEDVILEAEASLADAPLDDYAAVIVDEAQDLSPAMIRMLHSLVGDRPDGLTLVDDDRQGIYPGGATLAEAGVELYGRTVVLGTNYRTTAEITDFAADLLDDASSTETETETAASPAPGTAVVLSNVARHGPRPEYSVFPSRTAHDRSLVEEVLAAVDRGVPVGQIGVLALYSWHAAEAVDALTAAGLPVVELTEYDGDPIDAVKVGTIKRSKGLEFAEVFVVRTPPHLVTAGFVDPDDAATERRMRQRRELYVAMTRAREGLWVGVA